MKKLTDSLKKIEGNVLGIGLEEKYTTILSSNSKILNCDLLEGKIKNSKKNGKKSKLKKVNIKKLKKTFKNSNLNYIICNYEVIKKYMNTFVDDSVYINSTILFYNVDLEKIITKYKRYNCEIKKEKDYLIINCLGCKTKPIKKHFYNFADKTVDIIGIIGDSLMN